MKKIPEDANKRHPVMLLNQLKPNLVYNETREGEAPHVMFKISVEINGQEYVGRGNYFSFLYNYLRIHVQYNIYIFKIVVSSNVTVFLKIFKTLAMPMLFCRILSKPHYLSICTTNLSLLLLHIYTHFQTIAHIFICSLVLF